MLIRSIQRKCPKGHFLYPSLEQGLQLNDAISKFLIGIAS